MATAQLFLFDVRRWGLWAELPRYIQGMVATIEDAIMKRQTRGRLVGARRWSDVRLKVETAGLGKRAIRALEQRGFVRWEGDDLVLVHYDPRWEEDAAERSDRGRRNANRRWHPEAGSNCEVATKTPPPPPATAPASAPVMAPVSELCGKSAESFDPVDATAYATAHATADARARLQLQEHDLWIPEPDPSNPIPIPPSLPLTEDRGRVEAAPPGRPVGGGAGQSLSLGQMKVVRAYPRGYKPLRRMARFRQLWEELQLELHADWVIDLVDDHRATRAWLTGHVKLLDNFLDEVVRLEERPVADGCTADCCRGRWARGLVGRDGAIKSPAADEIKTAPAPLTPEQIAEMRAQARTVGKGARP